MRAQHLELENEGNKLELISLVDDHENEHEDLSGVDKHSLMLAFANVFLHFGTA